MTTVLTWDESLAMGLDFMDDTHREFVDLLAQAHQAQDADLLPLWATILTHTQSHFDREDAWMRDTGFASGNCHSVQHEVVLKIMREIERRGLAGEVSLVREMCRELGMWFAQHAQTMDAALALHLRGTGYDPVTGEVRSPQALTEQPIQGCGGACSGPAQAEPQPTEATA